MNNNSLAILTKLEQLVISSQKVPLTNKVLIDEEELLDLVDALRNNLPREIEEAKQIVAYKNNIINEAKKQAEQILKQANEEMKKVVNETEIVKMAIKEAEAIKEQVIQELTLQQQETDRYSEEVLTSLESQLHRALLSIQNSRAQLAKFIKS